MNSLLYSLHDLSALTWQPFKQGIDVHWIYQNEEGSRAAFLRYKPGASAPKHEHLGFEHIIVLAGSQRDEEGDYPKGSLVVKKPGSVHSVHSDTGCIVLLIWEKPVKFLEDL
jgi:anti-sigma factor ChrR (cupin superfamily)